MNYTKQFNIRWPEEIIKKATKIAKKDNRSVAFVIRKIVEKYFDGGKTTRRNVDSKLCG